MNRCPECDSADMKETTSGPIMQIPMLECRVCGTLEFLCEEDRWLPNWTPPVRGETA
jgi:hypothetical protein